MSLKVKEYTIDTDHILGKGQYGIVYDCSHPQIKAELCAKIVKTSSMDDKLINRESVILKKLKDVDNPNSVKVYDVIPDDEKKELYIIMEKVKGGDLKQDIDRRTCQNLPYTMTEVLNILSQIIKGYRTLFILNIIHRDLKPANILIENGKIKITDFGMGRVIEDMNKRFPHTKVGTPAYASPQLFLEPNYSSKSDIYSLGIILFQLVFLRLPFTCRSQTELIMFLKNLKIKPFKCDLIQIKGESQDKEMIRQLIEQMLIYSEEQRISWEELFKRFCNNNAPNNNIQQTALQNNSLIEDSIFIHNFGAARQIYNPQIFLQMDGNSSLDQKITRADRLNHLVKLLLAKARLVAQLIWTMIEVKRELTFLNEFNYHLIQMCLIGYRYKIVQNAYGFSHNVLDLICDEVRYFYKVEELEKALLEYHQDQSEQSQKVRNQAQLDRNDSNAQFYFIEKILIEHKKGQTYPGDINNFYRLINVLHNTEYKVYGRWFQYFYKKDLKDNYNFQESSSIGFLKLLALTQMFLRIDEEFPYEKYLQLDPKQVCLSDNPDRAQLIQIIKKYSSN